MDKILKRFKAIESEKSVSHKRIKFLHKLTETLDDTSKSQFSNIIDQLREGSVSHDIIQSIHNIIEQYGENTIIPLTTDKNAEMIEENLDKNINIYNGFSEKNPMKYVSYDNDRKRYVCEINRKKTRYVKLENARKKVYETLWSEKKDVIDILRPQHKISFRYQNKDILMYVYEENILFDIRHIINMLDVSESHQRCKYNEYSNKIIYVLPIINKFGGYIFRELITEETMYEIILSSNGEFSKLFKQNVSKILSDIRKDGKLFLNMSNNTFEYDDKPVINNQLVKFEGCLTKDIKPVLELSITHISCVYLFIIGNVEHLRTDFNIDKKFNNDMYVIKYGRTDDLLRRLKEHEKTFKKYNCDIKLKYYTWIDETMSSKAEMCIKKYITKHDSYFTHDNMTELACLTKDDIKDIKRKFLRVSDKYGSELKKINKQHEYEMTLMKNKLEINKLNYDKEIEKYQKENAIEINKIYIEHKKELEQLNKKIIELYEKMEKFHN